MKKLDAFQKVELSIFQSLLDRDKFTAQHSVHVAHLYKNSVSALGLEFSNKQAFLAGLFHDVGKIKAPDVIFSSKSPLSPEEYDLVRKHPIDSYLYLKACNIPESVCEIALLHHEREDGSGYPFGIGGKDIPPQVKLIAIVDSFCAIIEQRAYRKGVDIRSAFEILRGSSEKYNLEMLYDFLNHAGSIYKVTFQEFSAQSEEGRA